MKIKKKNYLNSNIQLVFNFQWSQFFFSLKMSYLVGSTHGDSVHTFGFFYNLFEAMESFIL